MFGIEGSNKITSFPLYSATYLPSGSSRLSRTPSSTGDRQKVTYFGAFYADTIADHDELHGAVVDGSNFIAIKLIAGKIVVDGFVDANQIAVSDNDAISTGTWYGFMVSIDTTQSTDTNRVHIYRATYASQPVEVTYNLTDYPQQNDLLDVNFLNAENNVGETSSGANDWDGEICWMGLIDGAQLVPANVFTNGVFRSSFNHLDFGVNGFLQKSENAGNMGQDYSPKGNHYTTTGTVARSTSIPS